MTIKAIVMDIEGTTSSLSFVKDVLFPYAREHMAEFIRQHGGEAEVRVLLDEVQALAGRKLTDQEIIAQLIAWIDEDRKITPLKTLQGMIWEEGYRLGRFKGHVYPDAAHHLQKWRQQGMRLYVYSSGSVLAQKLLFAHTEFGDLTPLFSGYFDTHIGGKRESLSYTAIALAIGLPPAQILFLSDIKEELDAARETGLHTTWLIRPPSILPPQSHHPLAQNFDAIAY